MKVLTNSSRVLFKKNLGVIVALVLESVQYRVDTVYNRFICIIKRVLILVHILPKQVLEAIFKSNAERMTAIIIRITISAIIRRVRVRARGKILSSLHIE